MLFQVQIRDAKLSEAHLFVDVHPMTQPDNRDSNDLYNVSVKQLELTANSIEILASVGILSVGDCLNFYHIGSAGTVTVRADVVDVMYSEVLQRLKEHDYLKND